ncbi:hypothetical protein RFI_25980, partial [Reticulomyxa filosa]
MNFLVVKKTKKKKKMNDGDKTKRTGDEQILRMSENISTHNSPNVNNNARYTNSTTVTSTLPVTTTALGHNNANNSNNTNNYNNRISGNEMRITMSDQQRQDKTNNDGREEAPDMAMRIIHGDDMHGDEKDIEEKDIEKKDDNDEEEKEEDIFIIVEDEGKDVENE